MSTKLQTLRDHCSTFETGLAACASRQEAEQLKEQICSELQRSCKSEMLRTLLDEHAASIIDQRFGRP